jgi:hypothetical protein
MHQKLSFLLCGNWDFGAVKTNIINKAELLSSEQMLSAKTAPSFLQDTKMNFQHKESGIQMTALKSCWFITELSM